MDSEAHAPGTHQSDISVRKSLVPFQVTYEQFLADRSGRTCGTANPSIMNKPFWKYMIATPKPWLLDEPIRPYMKIPRIDAYSARKHFSKDEEKLYEDLEEHPDPVWCYDRFGATATELPDGRLVLIGGEHEDSYDPDFCIYNDVVVIAAPQPSDSAPPSTPEDDFLEPCRTNLPSPNSPEGITIYGYPHDVFPPTDFHTSTYLGDPNGKGSIFIIGGLGYVGSTSRERTDVYRLDLSDFSIQLLETSGAKPAGGTDRHEAQLILGEDAEPAIKILTTDGKAFSLLINKLEWVSQGAVPSGNLGDY